MSDTRLADGAAGASDSSGGEPMRLSPRLYGLLLTAIILLFYGLMVFSSWSGIRGERFHDPDDLMRLQQVRDWIAGQSWFDVTQYRVNPPAGLPMHWSRLLDVPIAAVILLFRPLLGQPAAELVACVVVPFLTFAALTGLIARITRQIFDSRPLALLAAVFCGADAGSYALAHPLRIDHHGWQAVCALLIVSALLGRRSPRRAALAGAAAALWMHISLEGIVFAAASGAGLGLRWVVQPQRERSALPAYLGALTLASLALFLLAHGGALFDRTFCDAVSPVHMGIFALATLGSLAALRCAEKGPAVRLVALGLTALACAALYKAWAPQCGAGAFSMLTPLDVRLWYSRVAEGQPIWHEPMHDIIGWLGFPLIGLVGVIAELRSPRRSPILVDYGFLLLAATAIGVLVLRAGAVSNILAIPGALMLLRIVSTPIRAFRLPAARILAQAGAVLLLLPVTPAMLAAGAVTPPASEKRAGDAFAACTDLAHVHRLDALPTSLWLSDLDFASAIVSSTRHSVIAASYHRTPQAMDDVLRFFATDEAQARAVVEQRRPAYVYFCPASNSARGLAQAAPGDIAARLIAGRPPSWLRPVAMPEVPDAQVYSVIY
ncbi:hypothetical protein [Sphingomonas oligoaromativorans]|uniref:hypothetical protein n=1 Tax=Sphingomonas oligoaromativorans TaxID=575322 RepID=UPI00141E624F|nr:hypothetical protein [Sphingomonas oligoaromativorans]NIJ32995.1 hypothetical protein [Sphingomonas oligoaromativorans]